MTLAQTTAVILTRDEERNLPRALTSLPKGMPVFVLDALSRDRTVQFARAAGARVLERAWTDFVDARRFALAQIETPWVFMLDADEALDDVLRDAVASPPSGADAFRVERTTYFCGKPMRLWRGEMLVRLFRTDRIALAARPASGGSAALHERWVCDGRVGDLPGRLLHFSYPDVAAYRSKYERYTDLEAAGVTASSARLLRSALTGTVQLPWLLFGKGAAIDGWRGLYVAAHSAFYPAVVAWKALRR